MNLTDWLGDHAWALWLSRVKIAVTSETVMIECGTMVSRNELA